MHKLVLLILAAICSLQASYAAHSVTYDFNEGLPPGTQLYDEDHNNPAPDTHTLGFDNETPWVHYFLPEDRNGVACSTSWYSPAGTSNDWMVLPACEVTSDKYLLTWRAKASDMELRDGYTVCISTTGNKPEDFNPDAPIFETSAEMSEWTNHEVSLSKYAGQTIWIAFVNTSNDCTFLYIDDVFIGERQALSIRPAMSTVCQPNEEIPVKISVSTKQEHSLKGLSLHLEADGKEYVKECPDLAIIPGEEVTVDFGVSLRPQINVPMHCTLTAVNGDNVTEIEFDLTSFRATRVVEEYTGTWCEYCVRGIVALDEMKKAHPDEFIGIAIHCGGIERDPMDSSNSAKDLPAWNFEGYPYAIMNRSKTFNGDPKDIHTWFDDYGNQEKPCAGVVASATRNEDNITINSTVWFGENNQSSNWQLAYILIENDVHCPTDPAYAQKNAYAGGQNGPMGGFENLPRTIPPIDMWFQDVARWSFESAKGVPGSLPSVVSGGVPVQSSYTFQMPGNVLEPSNTECCVLLVNALNSRIANACKINLRELYSDIESVETDNDLQTSIVGYWTIEGIELNSPQKGINIVRYSDGSTRKIIIR